MTTSELEARRRAAGAPISELCVRSGVAYSRTWHALRHHTLTADEMARLERAMAAIEREQSNGYATAV